MMNREEMLSKFCESSFYIGGNNLIEEYCDKINECDHKICAYDSKMGKEFNKIRDKMRIFLKKHLELDNVNFLFGAGTSIRLGAISIRDIPDEIEKKIKESDKLYNEIFIPLVKIFQNHKNYNPETENHKWKLEKDGSGCNRWKEINDQSEHRKNIAIPLEEFINFLLSILYIGNFSAEVTIESTKIDKEGIERLTYTIKEELFKLCDLESLDLNNDYKSNLKYHKKFLKSLLGRPLNLCRANIFTTNYDLALENSFDELGIHYVNGFHGFNDRYFKPEVYNFDMFYPGNTAEGRVRRVEKFLRYFKLHGSLNWVREEKKANNIYGLKEYPIKYIRAEYLKDTEKREINIGDTIIYPTSYKKGYTLDFPYSELFRQFSASITQSQSVLFCIGYSFFDEHINDIIFQALSIPSFSLIIIDKYGNEKIEELKKLNDPRIIIMEGELLGDFEYFSDEIMPNFHELDIEDKISKTLKKLYSENNNLGSEEE